MKFTLCIYSCFEHGQAYVALSRVRSLEGLSLKGNDLSKITAHPTVKEFYEQLSKIEPKVATKKNTINIVEIKSTFKKTKKRERDEEDDDKQIKKKEEN